MKTKIFLIAVLVIGLSACGNSTSKNKKQAVAGIDRFAGQWSAKFIGDDEMQNRTFSLHLEKDDTKENTIKGRHCSIVRGGRRIDCVETDEAPSITGTLKNDTVYIQFVSSFGGKGQAKLYFDETGEKLVWEMGESTGENYLPIEDILSKKEENKTASDSNETEGELPDETDESSESPIFGIAGEYEVEGRGFWIKTIDDKENLTGKDSTYTLSVRPNEKLHVGKAYTDTFEYLDYNEEGDDLRLIVKKDGKIYPLIANELWDAIVTNPQFNKGDLLEIQWTIDFLAPAGDESIYFVVLFAQKMTKK